MRLHVQWRNFALHVFGSFTTGWIAWEISDHHAFITSVSITVATVLAEIIQFFTNDADDADRWKLKDRIADIMEGNTAQFMVLAMVNPWGIPWVFSLMFTAWMLGRTEKEHFDGP